MDLDLLYYLFIDYLTNNFVFFDGTYWGLCNTEIPSLNIFQHSDESYYLFSKNTKGVLIKQYDES